MKTNNKTILFSIVLLFFLPQITYSTPNTSSWVNGSSIQYLVTYKESYDHSLRYYGEVIYPRQQYPDIEITQGDLTITYKIISEESSSFDVISNHEEIMDVWTDSLEYDTSIFVNPITLLKSDGSPNRMLVNTDNWTKHYETPITDNFNYEDYSGVKHVSKNYRVVSTDQIRSTTYNDQIVEIHTSLLEIIDFEQIYSLYSDDSIRIKEEYQSFIRYYLSSTGLLTSFSLRVNFEISFDGALFVHASTISISMVAEDISNGFKIENDVIYPSTSSSETTSISQPTTTNTTANTSDSATVFYPTLFSVMTGSLLLYVIINKRHNDLLN
jgi:hypothetical protein